MDQLKSVPWSVHSERLYCSSVGVLVPRGRKGYEELCIRRYSSFLCVKFICKCVYGMGVFFFSFLSLFCFKTLLNYFWLGGVFFLGYKWGTESMRKCMYGVGAFFFLYSFYFVLKLC